VITKIHKTSLITGGAIRVGARIARFLHAEGYEVFITYNNSEDQARTLKNEGIVSEIFKIDCMSKIKLPKIDLLINNASVFEREEILDQALLKKNINIHLMQPIILADLLFHQTSNSHIINILDQMDSKIGKDFVSYHLTKKLLEETTKLHAELYYPKVRVNAIAPKILMRNKRQSEEHFQHMISKLDIDPIDILLQDILFLEESSLTGKIIYEK
jgi:pteridine reductase